MKNKIILLISILYASHSLGQNSKKECSSSSIKVPTKIDFVTTENNLMIKGYISDFHFTILSKWGKVIYETKDFDNSWDGLREGKKIHEGQYAWYVQGSCDGEEIILNGIIILSR